jgi:hypothetical protein
VLEDYEVTGFLKALVERSGSALAVLYSEPAQSERGFDPSRRALLTGVAAAVALGAAATLLPTPASAQYGNDDDDDDGHGRRRSRRDHGRRRSRRHGRRRSRREYRDWNEECFPTPLGWVCF